MEDKIKTYVLDACALIAFLRDESGSDKLLKLFNVISTDHHEFDEIEKSGDLSFFWLR